MTTMEFKRRDPCVRFGLKGPRAAQWLEAQGIESPAAPNTWISAAPDALLVARLGASEFFLEDGEVGMRLRAIDFTPDAPPPGVYPVLREDAAFSLAGHGSLDVLAQVCNVNFADLTLDAHPVIMTMMIGVAVLVVPAAGLPRRFRIWCDPSYGEYLEESLATVVTECGGNYRRST